MIYLVPVTSLGSRIRTARKAAKLTQEQLAEAAELNRVTVAVLEADKQAPSADTLWRIAQATKRPMDWFFSGLDVGEVTPDEVVDALDRLRRLSPKWWASLEFVEAESLEEAIAKGPKNKRLIPIDLLEPLVDLLEWEDREGAAEAALRAVEAAQLQLAEAQEKLRQALTQPDQTSAPPAADELARRRAARVQHAYEHLREAQAASQVEPGTEEAEEQSLRALAETFGDEDEDEER